MPPEPHATSGSVSSDASTTKLLSDRNSFSSLQTQTYVRDLLNTSVSSRMLFGDGVCEGVEEKYVPNCVVENEHECSVHSSQHYIDQEAIADHVMRTGSSNYCSVRELTYDRLYRRFLPKSKQGSILLCFSVNVVAFLLLAISITQYIKSIKYVYRYENCTLCADLTKDEKISITYLRRLGELKYCCFESSMDPVSRMNKAVMNTFDKTIKDRQLQRNMSIETNGTDAAMELTLEIGNVSNHSISDGHNLPMRKLKPLYGDLKVEQDRLVIQKPGIYFVRSQFYHNLKLVKAELNRLENVVGHDIHRANQKLPNDGKDQLLVNFYTVREYSPKTDYHVSHMAGIFRLEENDNIYVGVTENSTAYFDTSRNRLSLIFLGE